jgi:hypothetical protein
VNIGETLSQKTAERREKSLHKKNNKNKKHKKAGKDLKKSSKRVDSTRPTEKSPKIKKAKAAKPHTATATKPEKTVSKKVAEPAKPAIEPTPAQPTAAPTVAELRQQAKAQSIPGYSRMNKAELIAALK